MSKQEKDFGVVFATVGFLVLAIVAIAMNLVRRFF